MSFLNSDDAKFRLHASSKTVHPSTEKAEDAIRLADTFLRSDQVPEERQQYVRRGRASYYLRAALVFYRAGAIARARRQFLRALMVDSLAYSRLHLLLLLKSLMPEPIVRRRRR